MQPERQIKTTPVQSLATLLKRDSIRPSTVAIELNSKFDPLVKGAIRCARHSLIDDRVVKESRNASALKVEESISLVHDDSLLSTVGKLQSIKFELDDIRRKSEVRGPFDGSPGYAKLDPDVKREKNRTGSENRNLSPAEVHHRLDELLSEPFRPIDVQLPDFTGKRSSELEGLSNKHFAVASATHRKTRNMFVHRTLTVLRQEKDVRSLFMQRGSCWKSSGRRTCRISSASSTTSASILKMQATPSL